VCWSVLQCGAVCCSVLQLEEGEREGEKAQEFACVGVYWSVLDIVGVCWSVLECVGSVLVCVAVCCSVLQHVAACCSVHEGWGKRKGKSGDKGGAVRSSVLQCTAVCYSVLRRVAVW